MTPAGALAVTAAAAAGWLLAGAADATTGRLAQLQPGRFARPTLPPAAVEILRVAAAGLAAWYVLGPVAGLAGSAGLAAAPRVARRWARNRAAEELPAAAAAFCTALVLELRAGQPPETALARAAQDSPDELAEPLREALLAARFGSDMPDALRSVSVQAAGRRNATGLLARRGQRGGPRPGSGPVPTFLRQLAAAWQLTQSSGAGLSDVVDTLGGSLRAQDRLRRETAAALAGPRATAWLLAGLPVGGIALGAALGADPARVLLGHPVGRVCLIAGLALDLLGVLWVRRLVASAAGPA